jgi:TRAP-type transport system small permease protein
VNGLRGLLDRVVGKSVWFAAVISGIGLLWLMTLTIVAVVMRYVFNAPILGAQDLSQISLVVVVFPAMAYCGWTGGHVALDLFGSRVNATALRWIETIIHTTCGVLFAFIAWHTWARARDALRYGEATNLIEIPHAPLFFIIAVSAALYAVVLFTQASKTALGQTKPETR